MDGLNDTQLASVMKMLKSKDKFDIALGFEYLDVIYFQKLPLRVLKRLYKIITNIPSGVRRSEFEQLRTENVNRFRRLWTSQRTETINKHFEKIKNNNEQSKHVN